MASRRRRWKKFGICILILSFVAVLISVLQLWTSSPSDAVANNAHYKEVFIETETKDEHYGHVVETQQPSFQIRSTAKTAVRNEHLQFESQTTVAEPILSDKMQKSTSSHIGFVDNGAQSINQISSSLNSYKEKNQNHRNASSSGDALFESMQKDNISSSSFTELGLPQIKNETRNFSLYLQNDNVNRNEVNIFEGLAEGFERDVNRNEFAGFQNNLNVALPTRPTESIWNNSFDNEFISTERLSGVGNLHGKVMVVSMSLYGSDPRYTVGIIRNAELIKENFVGWTLRVYVESPLATPRFGRVPSSVIASLKGLGADIYHIVPEQDFIPPMMWRFLVADDLSVDYFIIRDSDSRLTDRDAAAVAAWIRSEKPFHSIRDHPSHASYAVSGGLWGGRTRELFNILRRSWVDLMRGASAEYLEDMNFLNKIIWPKVQNYAYCSDSVSCDRWPNSYPFPVRRYGYDHVGQVFDERDLGRPIDIRILKNAGENPLCTNVTGS